MAQGDADGMQTFSGLRVNVRLNVHHHHLSVDDGGVLATFGGGGVRVAGLGGRVFDGDELQGARGALIRICGTKGQFTGIRQGRRTRLIAAAFSQKGNNLSHPPAITPLPSSLPPSGRPSSSPA